MLNKYTVVMTKDIKTFINKRINRPLFLTFVIFYGTCFTAFSQKGAVFNLHLSSLSDSVVWVQEVVDDHNNGYLVTGKTGTYGRATTFIARLDCLGDILWAKKNINYTLSFSHGGGDQLLFTPLHLIGHNLVFASYNSPLIFNFDGQIASSKSIFSADNKKYRISNVIPYHQDGWIITGLLTDILPNGTTKRYLAILRMDNNFNLLWSKNFEHFGTGSRNSSYPYILVDNQKIVYFGKNVSTWFYTITLDQDGTLLSYKEYHNNTQQPHLNTGNHQVLSDAHYYYLLTLYRQKISGSYYNLLLHKIDKHSGKVVALRAIYDPSINRMKSFPTGTFEYSVFDMHWSMDSTIGISCFNSNYIRTGNYVEESYGYPTLIYFDTAMHMLSAKRYGVETKSLIVSDSFGSHNSVHILDSSFAFPAKYFINDSDFKHKREENIIIGQRPIHQTSCINELDMSSILKVDTIDLSTISMKNKFNVSYGPDILFNEDTSVSLIPFDLSVQLECYEPPYLHANISSTYDHYCIGDTVVLSGQGSREAQEFYWYEDDSLIGLMPSHSYPMNTKGQHLIALIVADDCFYDTAYIQFTVYGQDTSYTEVFSCLGDSIIIDSTVILEEGQYEFTLQNHWGCDSLSIVDVYFESIDTTFQDTVLCLGKELMIDDNIITKDTSLILFDLSVNHCDSITLLSVHFDKECQQCNPKLPLAFTPNGDNVNDFFKVINPCDLKFSSFSLSVFSRWGEMMFLSNDPNRAWNGQHKGESAPEDVYLVRLEAISLDGQKVILNQNLTLIR